MYIFACKIECQKETIINYLTILLILSFFMFHLGRRLSSKKKPGHRLVKNKKFIKQNFYKIIVFRCNDGHCLCHYGDNYPLRCFYQTTLRQQSSLEDINKNEI